MNETDRPSGLASLQYVLEVAKDWTVASFAAAQHCDFVPAPHRFELCDHAVRRSAVSAHSPEARSPLEAVRTTAQPTAWTHCTLATVLVDTEDGTVAREQEVIEILAMDDSDVLAEVAFIVRIRDVPPCLGRFWSAH
jgi:hypothetical protein